MFLFSPNGQETLQHFTKENSPLPSNTVNAIGLDAATGKVYFATAKGLISFQGNAFLPQEEYNNVEVYPNPVRPNFQGDVTIRGLIQNSHVKITDIEGNLVAEAQSNVNLRYKGYNLEIDGGTAYWNGKNLANNTVASGVYVVLFSDFDTFETKVSKIMIIR